MLCDGDAVRACVQRVLDVGVAYEVEQRRRRVAALPSCGVALGHTTRAVILVGAGGTRVVTNTTTLWQATTLQNLVQGTSRPARRDHT